ncbi:MAG TPA: solute carrier family 23 protein [Alcanivorax sp.]|nr:solute carrier family 23 protein [Alcanivorax sp.]
MGLSGNGAERIFPYGEALLVSMAALLTTMLVATLAHGLFRLLPILCGVVVGYLAALPPGFAHKSPFFTHCLDCGGW